MYNLRLPKQHKKSYEFQPGTTGAKAPSDTASEFNVEVDSGNSKSPWKVSELNTS